MRPEQDLRAVGGPTRIVAERRNSLGVPLATKRRDDKQSPAVLGAVHNVLSIGRPVRLPIVPRCFGDLHGIATAYQTNPNVELSAPIGAAGDKTPVGRPS